MLSLPAVVRVKLVPETDAALLQREAILVQIRFTSGGDYYYGGAIALTDNGGCATWRREVIERNFSLNQHLFPMDYKVNLEDCDSVVQIVARGGAEFMGARASALASSLTAPEARDMWSRARNESIATARTSVDLNRAPPGEIEVALPVIVPED